MPEQTPQEQPPSSQTHQEALDKSQEAAREIKQRETQAGRVVTAPEMQKIEEQRKDREQAARMALEELRASTGGGLAIGQRQAERGQHSEQFKSLIEKNLEIIRQTKERETLIKDFGETFAAKFKEAHPKLLDEKERALFQKLLKEGGKPRLVGEEATKWIENFMNQMGRIPEPEKSAGEPKAPEVTPSATQTPPETTAHTARPDTHGIETQPQPSPTPEATPGAPPTIETNRLETNRPEREIEKEIETLQTEIENYREIMQEVRKFVEKGEKSKKNLGLTDKDVEEYFPKINPELFASLTSGEQNKEGVAGKIKRDGQTFLSIFEQLLELQIAPKVSEAIQKRLDKTTGASNIEGFYNKITQQKNGWERLRLWKEEGAFKLEDIQNIIRAEIAKIIHEKDYYNVQHAQETIQHLKKTLQEQHKLMKEYGKYRRIRERMEQKNSILGEVLSEREREPISVQAETSFQIEQQIAKNLPEEVKNKQTGGLQAFIRQQELRLKRVLRSRIH